MKQSNAYPLLKPWSLLLAIGALVVCFAACTDAGRTAEVVDLVPRVSGLPDTVTFAEVAPIIRANCMPCHREGQAGPFPW